MSNFGKLHMARVHELPCGVCGAWGVHAHHILEGRTPGRKSPDALTIPLCEDCHTGSHNGIHRGAAIWKVKKLSELDVLADTYARLYG